MDPDRPHSSDLRRHRRREPGGTFFITKCLKPKMSALTGDLAETIIDDFQFRVGNGTILLGAFVIMPSHWHAAIAPLRMRTISDVMGVMDNWIRKQTQVVLEQAGTSWQDGFFDERIRSGKRFLDVLSYIEQNPVRKNWVTSPEQWKWSSANEDYQELLALPWPWTFEKDEEH